jgi:hypothetical protein
MTDSEEPTSPDSSKWIREATATVGLLGAIVGICISIWGLAQKSKSDARAADVNMEIAKLNKQTAEEQLRAHEGDLKFQAEQHNKDLERQDTATARENQAKEEQRVSALISEMLSTTANAPGNLAVLSSYIRPDHKYDEMVGNAVLAELGSAHSLSEVDLAFEVVKKLQANVQANVLILRTRKPGTASILECGTVFGKIWRAR